jgi:2-C-methyl-D-erythritol 4-phosphate cytidylyltransferase
MSAHEPPIHAVVVAAGAGSRFGGPMPKQYWPLLGQPVLAWSLQTLSESVPLASLHAVLASDDSHFDRHQWPAAVQRINGGRERVYSVRNALRHLRQRGADDGDWVLVHDAARPCVSAADIQQLVSQCRNQGKGGLLVTPVTDTVKLSLDGKTALETLDRRQLFAALTPQMFPLGELLDAIEKGDTARITDEASAMEQAGHAPLLVAGRADNLKITVRSDLPLAEAVLRQRLNKKEAS